jgi:sarcosine oxidase subunit beta
MDVVATADGPRPVVRPPLSSLHEIIDKLAGLLPGLEASAIESIWAGLIDLTPDAIPVLDRAPGIDGLVVGMGFSGHGFCLGPVTGQILCDLVGGRSCAFDISPFKFDRFGTVKRDASLQLHG